MSKRDLGRNIRNSDIKVDYYQGYCVPKLTRIENTA